VCGVPCVWAKDAKEEEFQEGWKTMKQGHNKPLDEEEVDFLDEVGRHISTHQPRGPIRRRHVSIHRPRGPIRRHHISYCPRLCRTPCPGCATSSNKSFVFKSCVYTPLSRSFTPCSYAYRTS
jgi:hypothetical protein